MLAQPCLLQVLSMVQSDRHFLHTSTNSLLPMQPSLCGSQDPSDLSIHAGLITCCTADRVVFDRLNVTMPHTTVS